MTTIIFEPHGTTYDNEAHLASGWYDVALSPLGKKQAEELGKRHQDEEFAAIFCSDLKRAYKTAEVAFEDKDIKIIKDKRLRECNYGDFTRHPSEEVEPEKANRIDKPFPNGESYEDAAKRMKEFLSDLLKNYDDKKVIIIGHRATQYGLEHWINHAPLKKIVTAPWSWQPGWIYYLKKI
jgi:broad specificity phosphatase PhoE